MLRIQHYNANLDQNTTYGWISGQFYAGDDTQTIFYNLVYFYNRQETVGGINHRLYYTTNTIHD